MPFPNYPDKHLGQAIFSPQDIVTFRRRLGRMPRIDPPENIILCLQRGLPERLRRRHPYYKAGRLMGDLYLLKRSRAKTAVMTNFGIGAPLIASLAEELIAWGAKRLISISWTGGLQANLKPGSIVIGEHAIRDEGTSHHYLPAGKFVNADEQLVEKLMETFKSMGQEFAVGTTWTTDAPYRETIDEVRQYQAEGVLTVEMESAGLLAIGQARSVQTASIFVVGDTLADFNWKAPHDLRIVEDSLEKAYAAAIAALD
jgi:uridine phosphorylase